MLRQEKNKSLPQHLCHLVIVTSATGLDDDQGVCLDRGLDPSRLGVSAGLAGSQTNGRCDGGSLLASTLRQGLRVSIEQDR